ncbi:MULTISPECIES: ImmA/IrrE family metallo-endopeptidase [unclassified Mesorhizobium]|uniref:ImmA/IrrE family metallo-endopeptidase n=1 Tax=unclassified Mesorhizobium TaxID=325217 RepID=UPI0004CE6B0D|nr:MULTISPECIES: ImmA/IrrE family metallo-endopeptidase [unclassified Mesorhizobium]
MDELSVAMKARDFIAKSGPLALPVSVNAYAAQVGGTVKQEVLQEHEDAWSVRLSNGKYRICVNCAHNSRRQRFSICHEVAHEALGIAADHRSPSWSFTRRPPGEIACDVFAAELLLPFKLFKPRVDAADMNFAAVSDLADEFDASLMSTGSRFATFSRELCAFVLSEGGKVRYCSRSTSLRGAKAWVRLGMDLPSDSYSARVRAGAAAAGPEEAEPDQWFEGWEREGSLYEDVRHLAAWDQTLTLLWFDDEDLPPPAAERKRWEEETYGLRELDGELPWPGRSKRRK